MFKIVECDTIKKLVKTRKGVMIMDLGDKKYNEVILACATMEENQNKGLYILDRIGTDFYTDTTAIAHESRESKGKLLKGIGRCQPDEIKIY